MREIWVYVTLLYAGLGTCLSLYCPSGHYGPPNCLGLCHCDAGDAVCDVTDGTCLSGVCARGWSSAPKCDTPCDEVSFGVNCGWECHCPDGDTCSRINGLCSSGRCKTGWAGPSCQTRLPELRNPVSVTINASNSITVTWRHWDPSTDIGTGPIMYYDLEYQKQGETTWTLSSTKTETETTADFVHNVEGLEPNTAYRFRITLGYNMADKWVRSVPGVVSAFTWTLPPSAESPVKPLPGNATNSMEVIIELFSRNATSLTIKWHAASGYKLCWETYMVTLALVSSQITKRQVIKDAWTLEVSEPVATFFLLRPKSQYSVIVQPAVSPNGITFSSELLLWTLPEHIVAPRAPRFINATNSAVFLTLYGVDTMEADIMNYQVIVEELSDNSSAGQLGLSASIGLDTGIIFDYLDKTQNEAHPNAYIAAELSPNDIGRSGSPFEVGNGLFYNGFFNAPLRKDSEYVFWHAVNIEFMGSIVRQMSRCELSIITANVGQDVSSSTLSAGYVALIAIFVIIVVTLIVAAVIFYLVRKNKEQHESYYSDAHTYQTGRTLETRLQQERCMQNKFSTPNASHITCKRRTLFDELDFESSGPPIHVPKTPGVVTNLSYMAMKNGNPIEVQNIKQYCMDREGTDYSIAEEFRHLPIGLIDTVIAATEPGNRLLNRTSHVLPYDSNRIKLQSIIQGEKPDYINASLVKTHLHTFYIVTQCPMSTTCGEFWRMVWEQNISVVVALMALQEPDKPVYEAYWPNVDEQPTLYHDIKVTCIGSEKTAHYFIRRFLISRLISKKEESRVVQQYQFVSWTKAGVPSYTAPFLDFNERIAENRKKDPGTILVHCQSGGGRSGMFVALDTAIHEGNTKGKVDVLKCVTMLRQERPDMVKYLKQYRFIYRALTDYFLCSERSTTSEGFISKFNRLTKINMNMNNARPLLAHEFDALDLRNPGHAVKRVNSILKDNTLPFVSPIKKSASFQIGDSILKPNGESLSLGLVVTQLDSFSEKDSFIVLKHPGKDQVVDFWDLVSSKSCSGIVSLSSSEAATSTLYLPGNEAYSECFGQFMVSVTEIQKKDVFTSTDFTVQEKYRKEASLRHFEFHHWASHTDAPPVKHMLNFIQAVRSWKRSVQGARPMVVHSNRGPDRALIFCLLWHMLEKIDAEDIVNIFRSVLHHRLFLQSAVSNAVEYRFLYQCVREYIVQNLSTSTRETCSQTDGKESGRDIEGGIQKQAPSSQQSEKSAPSSGTSTVDLDVLNRTVEELVSWYGEDVMEGGDAMDIVDLDEYEANHKESKERFNNSMLEMFKLK